MGLSNINGKANKKFIQGQTIKKKIIKTNIYKFKDKICFQSHKL